MANQFLKLWNNHTCMKIHGDDFLLYHTIILYVKCITMNKALECLVIDGVKYGDTFAYGYRFMESIHLYKVNSKEIDKITDLQEINRLQKIMVFN